MSYLELISKLRQGKPSQRNLRPTPQLGGTESQPWLKAWRELAALTYGITGNDPRFQSIMNAINACDEAYLANNWSAFQQARVMVEQMVSGKP